jgi:hypothetical protein
MTKYRVISRVAYDGGLIYCIQFRWFLFWFDKYYLNYSNPKNAIKRANELVEIEEIKQYNKKHERRVV